MFFSARASFGRACSFRPACCPRNRPTVRAANHHQKHLTHVKPQRPDKVATSHPPKARSMAPALRLKVSRWLAVQRNQPVVRVVVRSHRLRRDSENNWTARSAQCVDTNADDHSRKRAQLNCRCCWRGRKSAVSSLHGANAPSHASTEASLSGHKSQHGIEVADAAAQHKQVP